MRWCRYNCYTWPTDQLTTRLSEGNWNWMGIQETLYKCYTFLCSSSDHSCKCWALSVCWHSIRVLNCYPGIYWSSSICCYSPPVHCWPPSKPFSSRQSPSHPGIHPLCIHPASAQYNPNSEHLPKIEHSPKAEQPRPSESSTTNPSDCPP